MKKILYVILHTCTRPDRYDGVVNSWGKDVDFLFYSDCDNEDKKIVKVSDNSSYSSNEPKHINVIKYLVENNYQYEWFFFCDDDTFVNTKNLENNLDLFDKDKINELRNDIFIKLYDDKINFPEDSPYVKKINLKYSQIMKENI